jgi:hypothetical protein
MILEKTPTTHRKLNETRAFTKLRLINSSEKARIPAWTDRILREGTNLRQLTYNTAPLKFSDHRPVFATFECTVSIIDEAVREALGREIYEKRQSEVTGATANREDSDDEDLAGYDSIEPGLPPASSDRRKWWLDNGQPARSTLKPPQNGAVPNPNRPSNPYETTEEPDWVTVPRPSISRGPSQTSTRTPTSAVTNGPRKLPPPFNPSINSLGKNLSQTSLEEYSPPSIRPTPRPKPEDRRLSTSTTSSTSKKAGPPVARKPFHLSSSPSLTPTPTFVTISRVPQQSPRPTSLDTAFPPPPKGAGQSSASTSASGEGKIEAERVNNPPPRPKPRRQGKKAIPEDEALRPSLPPRPMDLLGDADDLDGWEALKPSG